MTARLRHPELFPVTTVELNQLRENRGQRYFVQGTLRRNSHYCAYADTLEEAQAVEGKYDRDHLYQVSVTPPAAIQEGNGHPSACDGPSCCMVST